MENNNNKAKLSLFSIFMYIIAFILLILFVYTFYETAKMVTEALDAGAVTLKDNFYDIFNVYMDSCGLHIFLAFIFVALGFLGNILITHVKSCSASKDEEFEDDELVDFYNENLGGEILIEEENENEIFVDVEDIDLALEEEVFEAELIPDAEIDAPEFSPEEDELESEETIDEDDSEENAEPEETPETPVEEE